MSVLRLIPSKGEAIVVDADEAIVGRETNSNVVVPHPSVSRRHALLKRKQDVFFVVDQGSANGTFVDSKRVVDAPLKEGSVLRFGSASFKIEVRADAPVESIGEDELVIAATMVGHAASFSATVHDGAALPEEGVSDTPGYEEPPVTVQTPMVKVSRAPEPASRSHASPSDSSTPAVAAVPEARNKGPAFWLAIGVAALALLFVGAALGLGAAFLARRMGLL